MNILALNTSSTSGSIAVSKSSNISFISYLDINITHSERLMPMIDLGLKQSKISIKEIDAIALANGPGSFTGIRIGLATAKGICLGRKIPLIPVNTLKLLASNLYGNKYPILTFLDAKMNEVYAALYSPQLDEIIPPQNSKPEVFLKKIKEKVTIIGDGFVKFKNLIEDSGVKSNPALPHQNLALASNLISLILKLERFPEYDFEFISNLEPYYLRKSQAELVRENKL
ncbi:MAG TPA: tRNA (adenosine(37)-N6)-threonylcarbamoyltransferase complex dimerization subunit type 1 TsaB [Candidatus Cloacimonetes bacterium]|nr:tRNA (adenosine(37)-N6)-threonylcarbamoyltransferase complex dimerization subunit type 1 TsaB [Candidatus Cloacimonadota bacterium]